MLKGSQRQMAHPHVDNQKMEQDLSKTGLSEEKYSCTELLNHRSARFCNGPKGIGVSERYIFSISDMEKAILGQKYY